MTLVYNPNNFNRDDYKTDSSDNRIDKSAVIVCKHLKTREAQWWQSHHTMVALKQRQLFWFGDNSSMMWLLWQLVAYVVVAILLMLSTRLLGVTLSVWAYVTILTLQTVLFFFLLSAKGRLSNHIQYRIDNADMACEQALNEMVVLAKDSIFCDVHTKSPISLQCIYEHCNKKLHLASLRCLLQTEVAAGRLVIDQARLDADILPIDLADRNLATHATKIIYKSTL